MCWKIKQKNYFWACTVIIIFNYSFLFINSVSAQTETSDSLIVSQMKDYGVHFTNDNNVKLLMSGKAKFADMFETVRPRAAST